MRPHIVQVSSGVASWYCAKLVIDRYGPDQVIGLFADVARDGGEWWEGEDPDNYRFLHESAEAIGLELVTVRDGRGVWGVAADENMIPNNRVAFCSRILKQEPARAWLTEHADPDTTTIYVGIDLSEIQRTHAITANWAPWKVEYPMLWSPMSMKTDAFDALAELGIKRPRMYDEGFEHANCAGACVRMGNGSAEHLYYTRPEVFDALEARENAMRERIGKDVAILVDRRGSATGSYFNEAQGREVPVEIGTRRPLPLSQLRAELEHRDALQPRLFDDRGCGRCFGELDASSSR